MSKAPITIRCKVERPGGSDIDIEGTVYRFRPRADGAHVAEVINRSHLARLLSIDDAYCLADDDDEPEIIEDDDDDAVFEAKVRAAEEATNKRVEEEKAAIKAKAEEAAKAKAEAAAKAAEEEAAAKAAEEAAKGQIAAPTQAEDAGKAAVAACLADPEGKELDEATIKLAFETVEGRKPNPKAKPASILAKVIEKAEKIAADAA